MFLCNFNKIVKKIWKNVGNISYKLFNILMEILWHFLINFWKNLWKIIGKILYGFCFLQECSYHSVYHDCAKYFPFKSANVSVLIGMRRIKSEVIHTVMKKVNSIQNDYKNYKRRCNILVILQNCKNLSQLFSF